MSDTTTYKEVRIIENQNAIARIHIPDLTDGERQRRMKALYKASEALLQSYGRRI